MVEAVIPRSSRILDAGCGSGVTAGKLMEGGYAVWGIDFAEPMIRQARELCGSHQFAVGDIEHMPYADNAFDMVVSLGVIEYLESDEQVLREIRRVLRPGGRAVIAISNGSSLLLRLDSVVFKVAALLRPMYHLVKYRFRGRPAPSPETPTETVHRRVYRRFYRSRWLRLLRGSNFELEEWICHGWGWLRSPLSLLVQLLSMQQTIFRRGVEGLFGRAPLSRASDRFVRSRALNWIGAEHIFRVRAIK
jgi:ubiquinone/menaquinone biosynthesis C-methylase UbiE